MSGPDEARLLRARFFKLARQIAREIAVDPSRPPPSAMALADYADRAIPPAVQIRSEQWRSAALDLDAHRYLLYAALGVVINTYQYQYEARFGDPSWVSTSGDLETSLRTERLLTRRFHLVEQHLSEESIALVDEVLDGFRSRQQAGLQYLVDQSDKMLERFRALRPAKRYADVRTLLKMGAFTSTHSNVSFDEVLPRRLYRARYSRS